MFSHIVQNTKMKISYQRTLPLSLQEFPLNDQTKADLGMLSILIVN